MAKQQRAPHWLDKAMLNPGAIFSSPSQVADNPELSLAEKLKILRSWEYDAMEISVSLEEGMRGAEEEWLPFILQAILKLNPEFCPNATSPTKHHALISS